MHSRNKQVSGFIVPKLFNKVIEEVDEIKYLGLIVDTFLILE